MSDWTKDPEWEDLPEMTLAELKRKVDAGARLVRDKDTFDAIQDLHIAMSAKGFADEDICEAVNALLDAQRKADH